MIDPSLVLFAVEAGVKLGRKLNDVLVDETAQRPLLMPLGDLFGSVVEADALRYFVDHRELIQPGGSCHAFRDDKPRLVQYYRAMKGLERSGLLSEFDPASRRKEALDQLAALDQFDADFKAKAPARRIFGTVVEIGIDYFAAHPEAMGRNSGAKKILSAFVAGLQDTDFAEGAGRQILGDLLGSALHAVSDHTALISDDRRLQVLFAGVTGAVADDLRKAVAEENETARQQLFRRIGSSLLRGTAAAFAGEVDLFLPNAEAAAFVKTTLSQVLEGIKGSEDIFNNQTLELVFKSALRAAAENPALMTDKQALQALIQQTAGVLADRQWNNLFSVETAGAVLHAALEVARENMETLIDPKRPQEQLLAHALAAMAGSLSAKLAGGGSVQDLLSRRQVVELAQLVLGEVAKNPEQLIGGVDGEPRKTVLAQVIASVAKALGDEPTLLTNGEGFLRLVRIALEVALNNQELLIDTDSASPATNLLYELLRQVVTTVVKTPDPRALIRREVFLDLLGRVLPLASANLNAFLTSRPKAVSDVVALALGLARGALADRINSANLPVLVEGLLRAALWQELDLDDAAAVKNAATAVLRAA